MAEIMETPMTVTGDNQKLDSLKRVLEFASRQFPLVTPLDSRVWLDAVEWAVIVDQQIKDAEFEQSINPLPFK